MRKSTNYNLNLAEGNDVVNPLVVDVPNYEIIDEAMKDNANAGVTVATELLTGTVHTLTRVNKDASVFRFIATSNYRVGETFTVDGVQVTALMSTGEPLSNGAYVINSNVLCCLTGTLLTVFTCVGGEYTAYNSARLGGKLAEDYGTKEGINEAIDLAQASMNVANGLGEKLGNHYIVDSGTKDLWHYRKWANGIAECWGELYFNPSYGLNEVIVTLPFTLISESFQVLATPSGNGSFIGKYGDYNNRGNSEHTGTTFVFSFEYDASGLYFVRFNFEVKGRWK